VPGVPLQVNVLGVVGAEDGDGRGLGLGWLLAAGEGDAVLPAFAELADGVGLLARAAALAEADAAGSAEPDWAILVIPVPAAFECRW